MVGVDLFKKKIEINIIKKLGRGVIFFVANK